MAYPEFLEGAAKVRQNNLAVGKLLLGRELVHLR